MPFGTPTQLTTWTADFYYLKNRCWGCVLRPQGVGAMSHWAVAMACQSLLQGACALWEASSGRPGKGREPWQPVFLQQDGTGVRVDEGSHPAGPAASWGQASVS